MRRRTILLGVAGAIALSPPAADADVLVAYDHAVSGQGFNIAVRNLQQDGANVTLPAGINTTANELHPTLSGDGRFLTFQRDTLAGPTPVGRPPVYDRQIIIFDLHAGRIVTPPAFLFSDRLRTTPAISSDARWIVNGNAPFLDAAQAYATITDRSNAAQALLNDEVPPPPPPPAAACPQAELCIAPGSIGTGSELSITPESVPETPGSARTAILNPAAGPGGTPLLAWSWYRTVRYSDGRVSASIQLRMRRYGGGFAAAPTVARTVTAASGEVFGHPAVVGDSLIAFERLPLTAGGAVGPGDIWAVDTAGRINRSLPQVNTAADERQPAWTRDGRFLAVLRRATDGSERVLLFDFANNLLVNPAGLAIPKPPADTRPLGESRPLQGSISVADDPTARTETINLISPKLSCTSTIKGGTPQPTNCTVVGTTVTPVGKSTTVGILARRIEGSEKVLGRSVHKLGPQIRLPLGKHSGRTRIARKVGRALRPGRYLLTLRSFGKRGQVRTLAKPRIVRVR